MTGYTTKEKAVAANVNTRERDYWLNKLSGELVKTTFFYDYNRLRKNERRIDTLEFKVPGEVYGQLMKLSSNSDHTLHIILAAGLALLLHKYNDSDDIILGTPIYKQAVEGDFINTILALRNWFKDNMTFKDLLLQMKETVLEAVENQNYPIETLLYKLDMKVSAGDFPLLDTALLLKNIHDSQYLQHINLNVIFSFFRSHQHLEGVVEYNTVLYEKSTIERIVNHLIHLFHSVLENIDSDLSTVTFLPEAEKKQILFEFNDTKQEVIRDKCCHRLFENQAAAHDRQIAVIYNHHHITYGQLNEEANRIAHLLSLHGVKPGTMVGIYMKRGIKMLASIISVFKAGGFYLPLEVDYPEERIKSILEDSDAGILITRTHHMDIIDKIKRELPFLENVIQLTSQDKRDPGISGYPAANLAVDNDPDNLAYIIYTSGTSGKPKGVMIHQVGMINHLYAKINDLSLTAQDRVAQTASACFDISVWQFLSALLVGGSIVIIDREVVLDPGVFLQVLQRKRVTILESVPSLMIAFLDIVKHKPDNNLTHLRRMIPTGEALSAALAREWYRHYPDIELVNAYGPTEASDDVTHYVVDSAPPETQKTVPVGKPLQNLHIYIVDKHLSLCPIGVRGEICVAGIGVGKGYWKNDEKTKNAFIPNPFLDEYGDSDYALLYRTGDIGYFREDGNLECLGRIDSQVKIRGNRIELEEIENQLLEYKPINEAVVLAKEDERGNKYLYSYIVSEDSVDITGLRSYLSAQLPDYMVPSYFMQIPFMPLTPNGKIDRKALPEPKPETSSEKEYIAPKDEVEKKLAGIWSEVLEIESDRISIDDNFFELGGHSLRATVLVARLHEEFNVKVPLTELFKTPFIRDLAGFLRSAGKDKHISIGPAEQKEYYRLSPAQKRLYFIQHMDEHSVVYNIPHVVMLGKDMNRFKLECAFRKLLQRHESLRTSFEMIDGIPYQKIHEEIDFQLEFLETHEEEAQKMSNSFLEPFDLAAAPLFRVWLNQVKESGNHILLMDMHHIISDGVSEVLMVKDLLALYSGETLTPLKLQYKDYSEWQNRQEQVETLKKQEEYWLNHFEGKIPELKLPYDYVRPAVRTFAGSSVDFEIGPEQTAALIQLAAGSDSTLYIVLLAVFNVLLAKVSGQEDIVVGVTTAGRSHSHLENIIGIFVNTLAIRNYPSANKRFYDFMEEVRERTLWAFENQDYQFDDLLEKLDVNRNTNRNPLFDTMFTLQNQFGEMGDNPREDTTQTPSYQHEHTISKFDLNLNGLEVNQRLLFNLEYSTALFRKETIDVFLDNFKEIIFSILENPYKKIKEIEIISREEEESILNQFNESLENE